LLSVQASLVGPNDTDREHRNVADLIVRVEAGGGHHFRGEALMGRQRCDVIPSSPLLS
jgi:hypothetical protein